MDHNESELAIVSVTPAMVVTKPPATTNPEQTIEVKKESLQVLSSVITTINRVASNSGEF